MANTRIITKEELSQHKDGQSCWLAIHDKVYDVTRFLKEHPGGVDVLLEQAGSSASEPFENVGHSTDARELLENYQIGELAAVDREEDMTCCDSSSSGGVSSWLISLGFAVIAALVYGLVFAPSN